MARKEIAIDTAALNRDINEMSGVLRRIRAEMDGMYGAVRALNRMWRGPANESFNKTFNRDYETMEECCRAVDELIECMRNARYFYENGERQVEEIIRAVRV